MLRVDAATRLDGFDLDVAVEIPAGRCLALAGPSGAGKTTVLRVVAGLARPDRGRVSCGERTWLDTASGVHLPPERRRCAYVFQDYALFGHLPAWRNVAYPLSDLPRRERRARAHELLDRFGLSSRADAHPRALSGGERQRVAIARALARRPDTLLLDEPLSALDARTRAHAARELTSVLDEIEVPTLLVTHDFAEAAQLGDRVGVMDRGRVIQQGTPSELAAQPRSAFVADFTGAVVLTGSATAGAGGLTRVELDGGGSVLSTDVTTGPVAATVYPWEIAIAPGEAPGGGSERNRLAVEVVAVTVLGNRVRLGLRASQALTAEITRESAEDLGLVPGSRVTASWKAAATRLVAL